MNLLLAVLVALVPPILLVGSIYIWYFFVGEVAFDNTHPTQKIRRIVGGWISVFISLIYTRFLKIPFTEMGISLSPLYVPILSIAKSLVFILTLYLGPIYHSHISKRHLFDEAAYSSTTRSSPIFLSTIILSPLLEEIVYRGIFLGILHTLTGKTFSSLTVGTVFSDILFSTLAFSTSHIHHIFEKDGNMKRILPQLFVTAIFGFVSTLLFDFTHSIAGPFVAHAFCNLVGAPPLHLISEEPPLVQKRLWAVYVFGLVSAVFEMVLLGWFRSV
ncbi:putative CAAX protease family protein [Blattamonas nauphoetae]|uniref:intramembrane prenyl-peptidase Rce1 n=1 Tax=Blattamonas nauphoetae TaxID=2049346 RepID=A0ABQ9XZ50_9EUKA|nr:putative CAAX protease family protein [Blattamonas nauphoetae]